jgi:hypothetical protein
MALLSRTRRPLAIAVLAALALPALLLPASPHKTVSVRENRMLARQPAWPRDLAGLRQTPRQIDAYLADHFALRDSLVRAGQHLKREFGGQAGPPLAVEGRDGWLFFSDGLLQSSGQVRDAAQSAGFASFVCDIHARLAKRGVRTGFALIPSPGEVYPEGLPLWAGPAQRPTDYDDILARVRTCGVEAVDLRPALIAARAHGQIYRRTDSHWTLLGAVYGYNAMLDAIGRPDWRLAIDPNAWHDRVFRTGDLPAMAGLEPRDEHALVEERFEQAPLLRTAILGVRFANKPPFVVEGKKPGPTVLLIGDSYTEDPMAPLFLDHVGRYAWVHHDECAFDWAVIDKVKPDIVLIAPVEREARCRGGRPLHLPAL